jgi:hypothetical protein
LTWLKWALWGLVMASTLTWASIQPKPGAMALTDHAGLVLPTGIQKSAGVAAEKTPPTHDLGVLTGQKQHASAQAGAPGSRACCASDGQTCVMELVVDAPDMAPDSRRARWLPPKDSFSSAEPQRRDRPPRMTA